MVATTSRSRIPGRAFSQRPTISSLSDDAWVAVNTIIEEKTVRDLMPKLKAAGAQGLVEYPLNKIVL